MSFAVNEMNYILWQDRATDFYVAGRSLIQDEIYRPACFCVFQTVETMLKSTLFYWERNFNPRPYGHNIPKLIRTTKNKVKGAHRLYIPAIFYYEQRYQLFTRYPDSQHRGISILRNFLDIFDETFFDILSLTPFQPPHTKLHKILSGRDEKKVCDIIARDNKKASEIKKILEIQT